MLDGCLLKTVSFKSKVKLDPSLTKPNSVEIYTVVTAPELPVLRTHPFDYIAFFSSATNALLHASTTGKALEPVHVCRVATTTEFLFAVATSEPGRGKLSMYSFLFVS